MRALLACLVACAVAHADGPRLARLDGTSVSFASLQTPVMVIDFWATFCAPCLDELPSLQALSDAIAPSVAVLAVSIDGGARGERVREIAAERKLTLPVLRDVDRALLKRYFPRMTASGKVSVPQLVVVDASGRGFVWSGYDPDESVPVFVARLKRAVESVRTRPFMRSPGKGWLPLRD